MGKGGERVDFIFFFFQAEDGIRDHCVTGVQTCALPICNIHNFGYRLNNYCFSVKIGALNKEIST